MNNYTERKLIEDKLACKYKKLCKIKKELEDARQFLHQKEQEFAKAKREYCRADKERAMIDGRFEELKPHNGPKTRKKKEKDFTKDEVMEIAKKLGVNISINL